MLTRWEKLIFLCFMIRGGFLNIAQRQDMEQITWRPIEPHGVARRANAILLLDDGKSCALIAELLYLDDDTVRSCYKQYMSGGFGALETFGWKAMQVREASSPVRPSQAFCGMLASKSPWMAGGVIWIISSSPGQTQKVQAKLFRGKEAAHGCSSDCH